jgi:hypothetical protein
MPGVACFGKKREIGQIKLPHETPRAKSGPMGLFNFNNRISGKKYATAKSAKVMMI